MSLRRDDPQAYFAPINGDAASLDESLTNAAVTYLDWPAGYYQCWIDGYPAGQKVALRFLDMPDPGTPPTTNLAGLAFPTAGAGPKPIAQVPSDADFRLVVETNKRIAVAYSAAGPVLLHGTRVQQK